MRIEKGRRAKSDRKEMIAAGKHLAAMTAEELLAYALRLLAQRRQVPAPARLEAREAKKGKRRRKRSSV